MIVNPKSLTDKIGLPHLHNEENDRRHASRYTHDRPESAKMARNPWKIVYLTWIERRLCYPKFEPREHRHSNPNPNEHERVCEPLPSCAVRLKRPIHVHTPKGDEGREPETHDAVYIRLYHAAERFGRIIIHSAV